MPDQQTPTNDAQNDRKFTSEQIHRLQSEFSSNPYPTQHY